MLAAHPDIHSRARARDWLESALTFLLVVVLVGSWATHILVCVASGAWGLLAVGLLVCPVAVVHGLAVLVTTWL